MRDIVMLLLTVPPDQFPETVDIPGFFLEPLCCPLGIWLIRCLLLAAGALVIGVCIYKDRHSDGKGK